VEVIKGVASALYGSSALGGVINLVSRRPAESQRELLQNVTSRKGSDTVFWLAEPKKNDSPWSYTLLGGAHFQGRSDIDKDGYADLPEYERGVLRPRIFWENGKGNSVFVTGGAMTGRHRRQFGNATERDTQGTFFGEAALSGSGGGHNWTIGSALQSDRYRN